MPTDPIRTVHAEREESKAANPETSQNLSEGWWSPLWEFLVHVVVGSTIFFLIVLPAVVLNLLVRWLATVGVGEHPLLGSSLSEEQEELLATHFKRAMLMLDGDEAGRAATDECLKRLGRRMFVKALELPDGKQPDMLSREEIVLLLMKGKAST